MKCWPANITPLPDVVIHLCLSPFGPIGPAQAALQTEKRINKQQFPIAGNHLLPLTLLLRGATEAMFCLWGLILSELLYIRDCRTE